MSSILPLSLCNSSDQAFNHVASVINDVYEELTKDEAHPHGGDASLSLTEHTV